MVKPKIAFICVHNSCRSQMAEALAKIKYANALDIYSAGTEKVPEINQTAVKLIKERFNVDMNKTQNSKTIDEIPNVDIVITMGCNVDCPNIPSKHREDWGLDDPSGKEYEAYEETLSLIEVKMDNLLERLHQQEIVL